MGRQELHKQDLFKMIENDFVSQDKLFNRGINKDENFRIYSQTCLNLNLDLIESNLKGMKLEFVRHYAVSFYYDMVVKYRYYIKYIHPVEQKTS
jgi:hypothetical protein